VTPYAWSKLLRLRDLGDTEVGGFGITSPSDLLLIEDFCLVEQRCTPMSVEFADESVADYFDQQVDEGRVPEQFARIWVHTHPGDSPHPSHTDEATFERCFGGSDWALMFILARGGDTYARLRFNTGPGGEVLLPVEVDYSRPFPCSDWGAWDAEYAAMVTEIEWPPMPFGHRLALSHTRASDDGLDPRHFDPFDLPDAFHDDSTQTFLEEFHERFGEPV
jgi:hypothetical protein